MKEYELKARLEERIEALRLRLVETGWRLCFRGEMDDQRLDSPGGDLERKDEVLRLRRYTSQDGENRTVLGWKGPADEELGFKLREEWETVVEDGVHARMILSRLGYSAVTLEIDRRVEVYEKCGVQVRIEEYPDMDVLVEIEGDPSTVEDRMGDLGLEREAWKSWPLARFVEHFEERTGRPARLKRGT